MNRILFAPNEFFGSRVAFGGARFEHVVKVLHGEVGQVLKTGTIDGKIGSSRIVEISENAVVVETLHDHEALPPWMDLILAPPRPRVMKRLLPQLATMGVGRLVLVGAKKVEKDFWGATLLKEENYRPLLIDGMMQGGVGTKLPELLIRRNFQRFIRDDFEGLFPASTRIVAHPYSNVGTATFPSLAKGRLLLAVGPEGGWTDDEVLQLETFGFSRYSLGARILRTDTAVVSLLAQFSQKYECR